MENIEFIAAKDLPATEAEEVDVLCVENGELKRKPGASLGGGVDAVIDLGTFYDTEKTELTGDLSGGSVPAGTVAMIIDKINAGEMPKIHGIIRYSYYDTLQPSVFEFTAFGPYGEGHVRCLCDAIPYSGIMHLMVELSNRDSSDGVSVPDYIERVLSY